MAHAILLMLYIFGCVAFGSAGTLFTRWLYWKV